MPNLCHNYSSEMQTLIPYKTTKCVSALSLLHSHQVQIHSANEALFMFWFVQTEMVIALLLLSRLFLCYVCSLNVEHGKSKAYFHMSYNQSSNKSIINDIMNKFTNIITVRHMPFAFLVGDLPVYVLVTLLKAENSVRYDKWKAMKKESFLLVPPDTDCLPQHFIQANYLMHLVLHPLLKKHPSPIGHGWELMDGNCCPVRHHTYPALPTHLPTLYTWRQQKKSEEDKHEENDEEQEEGEDDSEQNEEEWSDLN